MGLGSNRGGVVKVGRVKMIPMVFFFSLPS